MAGQTPEPSWQPAGQDSGLTQGRPAWQAPSGYTPPGGASASPGANSGGGAGQAYAAPPPSYPAPDQAYPPPDQAYPQQEQTFANVGQGPNQDYQGGYQQGYQRYGAQQAQGAASPPPQWQGFAGLKQAGAESRPRPRGEKGFVGSLFDFSFSSFVTPKIVRVLYVLVTLWTALLALIFLVIGFKTGGVAGGLFTLIVIEPIFVLLTLGIYRVVLEAFMVVFRIYEEAKKIRENTESQG